MFGKKDPAVGGFASGSITVISKATEIIGDLHFSGNLEVEGVVRGNLVAEKGSDARVRIDGKGCVEGEIHVPTVVINGHVKGDVYSSKHLELAAKAVVEGNVHYQLIEMVKGAQVNGNLLYLEEKAQPKAPEKPAKSEPKLADVKKVPEAG